VAGVNPFAPTFDTVGILASSGAVLARAASVLLGQEDVPIGQEDVPIMNPALSISSGKRSPSPTPRFDGP
jgi:Asp-tRNA(Asn)/Glu-tRNA(Gln) amidotransferase A subunit family amidase